MKQYWFILYFLVLPLFVFGQGASIVKDLNASKQGEGSITIYQDESIEGLIGSKFVANVSRTPSSIDEGDADTNTAAKPQGYREARGYKIQVFSGNEQRRSKAEAYAKKDQIQNLYPELEINVTFRSPVWRVRVGNYRSYEEAFEAMKDMKEAFPAFGKEMQIVEAVVKLPVYN